MTPKEKADKLCMRFLMHTHTENNDYGINKDLAKQCALIAVDEILKSNPTKVTENAVWFKLNIEYWQEVKQEINEL